jgi:hypothetical protein
MVQRILRVSTIAALVFLAAGLDPVKAKYRYGRYAGGSERGYFITFEAALANPRNADAVVATRETIQDFGGGTNSLVAVIPTWDDDFAGRLGVGYAWASGNRVSFSFWSYETDQSANGSGPGGGLLHFAVGPPIWSGGEYVGNNGSPGFFDLTTELEATTADLAWGKSEALGESFTLEWSAGLRYASYEETTSGTYDEASFGSGAFGTDSFAASKSNEGEMFGVRIALRGSYRLVERFSVDAGLGVSFVDGELTAASTLTPTGTGNQGTTATGLATVEDDSRSGSIRDVDLSLTWHSTGDALRVWVGWEQSIWDEIARDVVRNFPGTSAPLRERDSVTISSFKLGVYYKF